MRVAITARGWALEAIGELEWLFLERLPGTALGEELPVETRRRLLPDPIVRDADEGEDDTDFLEDWDELVRPELNAAFAEARDRVAKDLKAVVAESATGEVAEKLAVAEDDEDEAEPVAGFRLEVPAEHADSWYSALNQARLLMNEVYDLADSEQRFFEAIEAAERGEEPVDGVEEKARGALPDGMMLMMLSQYQFYGFIQNFLVENIMKP